MVRGSLRTRLQNPDLPQFEWSSVLLSLQQEEFGKIFAAAEEYRLNIGHGGAGKGQIVGFAKHPEAWTVSRLLDFSFLEKNPQKPELEIVDEEKEILDKTGYLITYRSTQLLEIPDED
ncbi:3166_t:CDS:2 [Rhizophagus irregularis]|nr:3166_t:CDS:2 [Rhizophagus irregularis]